MVSHKTKIDLTPTVQWVPDGPLLPLEVLEALEDGDLVLFCGAGISMRAGLPNFKGLVKGVYDSFPGTAPDIEELICAKEYDRAFYALELRYRKAVRRKVCELLQLDPDADCSTHEAVLRLATDQDGRLRCVTTNFDLAFESGGHKHVIDCAPALPIPKKDRWNSLVYLHGRLPHGDDSDLLEGLVLSSADFGLAYLTEGWASRFITELFRRYKILFVGYSADDPVMRYMLDAFAADRVIGESVRSAFALVGARRGEKEKITADWQRKGVTPIVYTIIDEEEHGLLHETLKHWADRHAEGLQGKAAIIQQHASSPLIQSSREQVCWALRDATGLAARKFAEQEPAPPIEWLYQFERAGLLGIETDGTKPGILICTNVRTSDSRVIALTNAIASWLTKHLSDRRLSEWVIEHGSYLHPIPRRVIRQTLADPTALVALSDGLRLFWSIITSEEYAAGLDRAQHTLYPDHQLKTGVWTPLIRREVLFALSPYLRLRKAWPRIDGSNSDQRLSTFAESEIHLRAGEEAVYWFDAIESRTDRDDILRLIAHDLAIAIEIACDLLTMTEQAGDGFDHSYIWHPSIEDHEQNLESHGWLSLIPLARDAVVALATTAPPQARALLDHWTFSRIPLLRRFVLFAAAKTTLFSESEIVDLLLMQSPRWLWSHFVQREAFQLLEYAWPKLDSTQSNRLLEAILAGPARVMFRADINDEDYSELQKSMIASRLECFQRTVRTLPEHAERLLTELRPALSINSSTRDRSHFPSWSSWTQRDPSHFDPQYDLRKRSFDEKLAIVAEITPDSEYLPAWRRQVHEDIDCAIDVLTGLANNSRWPVPPWKELLLNLRVSADHSALWHRLCTALVPAPTLAPMAAELANALRDTAKSLPATEEPCIFVLWDRIAPTVLAEPIVLNASSLSQALNCPQGALAEIVLDRIDARQLQNPEEVPSGVWDRLSLLARLGVVGAVPAQTRLSTQIATLFRLNAAWVRSDLVPLFSWEDNPYAEAAWRGYLWQFGMPPDLWPLLKKDFLNAVRKSETFDEQGSAASRFTAICIHEPGWIAHSEAAEILQVLSNSGRASAARVLSLIMKGSEPKADVLWRDRIGPWFAAAWPRDQALRDASTSFNLALTVVQTQAEFPQAVKLIVDLVVPSKQFGHVTQRLQERHSVLPELFPIQLLQLLSALVDTTYNWVDPSLAVVLARIATASPACAVRPDFQRLRNYIDTH